MELLPIVRALEGKNDGHRRQIILEYLSSTGARFYNQSFFINRANIVADFCTGEHTPILIGCHYDRVAESPGANDDASAVAVSIGLCERLAKEELEAKIAFFDLEENIPFKGGLNGSKAYVKKSASIGSMFNMELVGEGNIPVYWPIKNQSQEYLSKVISASHDAGHDAHFLYDIVENSGDHESFLHGGVHDSICLTMCCEEDRDMLMMVESMKITSIDQRMIDQINKWIRESKTFKNYHRATDKSEHIKESSLQTAMQICYRMIQSMQNK